MRHNCNIKFIMGSSRANFFFQFKLIESFERLDLQLNVELWFTENDYKPPVVIQKSAQTDSFTNLFPNNSNPNNSANSGGGTSLNNSVASVNNAANSNNGSSMQQLCCRTFKIKFDPRQGIHLQIPVIFDYFHLSGVLTTIHCTLLTLLPPVMLGYLV